ncbi:hypothetical protein FHX49_002502 [Microbacterium endophyticum]|uniref:Uncharacterized protein n=1 Tax=Microbacterium endophyticum TaxID=1526412 RepID=A0A7W4YNT8_9MICO|nr:hypothetical protein [Microbacterium endophyticum]MBB2976914.1 hypothetical protein [Microbacterium endophyticum]NIK35768.1 hypothetical protein [Microbacterium endophyticum]
MSRRLFGAAGVGIALASVLTAGVVAWAAPNVSEGDTVDLAGIVASWPDSYQVTGTKSEPLYTERIVATRDGDTFAVRIEVLGQGDAAMGTQLSAVRATSVGIEWITGCTKSAALCADDSELRGFLATATVVEGARNGTLPETGVVRVLHGTDVVCIDDEALHPNSSPALVPLDPCVDIETGAVLGHWSTASAAFVGATLADGFTVIDSPNFSLLSDVHR